MHLHWFSPLPPAHTDVAGFTARVAPALATRASLTFWTDANEWDRDLERWGEVRVYDRQHLPDLRPGDLKFFNIGNAPFHKNIFRLAQVQSGVVILHEVEIPTLVRRGCRSTAGVIMAEPALAKAAGVVLHSRCASAALRSHRGPVLFHPLPFPAGPSPRREKGSPARARRLLMFGFIGRNRRLQNILRALQLYPQKEEFRLDIYGEVSAPWRLRLLLAKLGLTPLVRLHGFVSERELDSALAAADLVINLRYPTMGEASGSQLRIWRHALPALVTPAGWFLECPAGTVAYVEPENEIAELHRHFGSFQRDPATYREIGARGRRTLIEQHKPESYADAILQFAAELLVRRAAAAVPA
jgi:glycosyltransferase involved in cell wall biosynthesis